MWLSDSYDVPQALIDDPPSPIFRQFLLDWFGSARRVSFNERLSVAGKLMPEETEIARQLIRQNLKCRHIHVISGTWVLGDLNAIPLLRSMFEEETNESRRLTIAGALWKLNRDPVFMESLIRARESGLLRAHLMQVLWLNDGRSLDFLIDTLPSDNCDEGKRTLITMGKFLSHTPLCRLITRMICHYDLPKGAGPRALNLLNHLEAGHPVSPDEQHPPSYYRTRRNDPAFREAMVRAVQKAVNEMHQGR